MMELTFKLHVVASTKLIENGSVLYRMMEAETINVEPCMLIYH